MSALTSSSPAPTAQMFELEPRYRELQDEARGLADAMEPFAVEADAMSTVHAGMREALASSKLWELVVPGPMADASTTSIRSPLRSCARS